MSAFAIAVFATATVEAQTPSCPPEVAKAKEQLNMRTAKADTQAPRALAGSRPSNEAPRGQDVQAPRSVAGSKAGSSKAISLVKEAEAACAKGDMTTAKAKAEAALAEMK